VVDSDTLSFVGDTGSARRSGGLSAYLVLAMETQRPLAPPARFSLAGVDEVLLGRGAERSHVRFREHDRGFLRVYIPDGWMSGEHARIIRTGEGWLVEDKGSKNGTYVGGHRTQRVRLADGDIVETGSTMLLFRVPAAGAKGAANDLSKADFAGSPTALATLSPELQHEFELLPKIAGSTVPVLILGETGTGKEVIARTVHELSGRRGPFTPVNCGALPDTLIESELFGAKKGAYSGAVEDRPGLVRASDKGTLFLDEIAELPEPSQATLLRVLQESEVTPIGGTKPLKVDIRVLAATHQALAERVEQGRFRKDLYARLIGFQIRLPPLRERREDIGLLVGELLPRLAGERAERVRFTRGAARTLFSCAWPLNIRELEHALGSALALAGDDEVASEHLPESIRGARQPLMPSVPPQPLEGGDQGLRDELVALLEKHDGNVSAVARDLGKERVQIRRWARRLGIDLDAFRR
jgi:DNA-binding NtrC family response regulator